MGKKWTDKQKAIAKIKREEKLKEQEEERILLNLKRSKLSAFKEAERALGEPTISFIMGERVQIGAWTEAYIDEIYKDGKVYGVKLKSIKEKYGKLEIEENYHYWPWYSIAKYKTLNEIKSTKQFHKKEELRVVFLNMQISSLFCKFYNSGTNLNPSYQRGLEWTLGQKQDLINSIFNDIDIGKFTFIRNPYSDDDFGYEILDGKQRLNALLEFCENRFQYEGVYFSDLHPFDKYQIKDYGILIAEIVRPTEKQKLQYFVKLNTSGIQISKEHIDKVRKMERGLKCKQ